MEKNKSQVISEAILNFSEHTNIIMKIEDAQEKKNLNDLTQIEFVDASYEISNVLVNHALS